MATELYERNPRGMMAIIIKGEVVMAPTVESPRLGPSIQIVGNFTEDEARSLAEDLNAELLPVPIGSPGRPHVPLHETWVPLQGAEGGKNE